MQELTVERTIDGAAPRSVFDALGDFVHYPRFTDAVIAVSVEQVAPGVVRSSWAVRFRRGILKWIERDVLDATALTIEFEQLAGDLELFRGRWRVEALPDAGRSRVRFEAALDLGMPTIAAMLEPIAARALEENVVRIIHGLAAAGGATVTTAP